MSREAQGGGLHGLLRRASASLARAVGAHALRGVNHVGARVAVDGGLYVSNFGTITIGDDVSIASRSVQSHLVTGPGGTIAIGSRVSIGAGAAITAHDRITIGDDVRLGEYVIIMDTDFHGTKNIDDASATAPIVIEDGAQIGEKVTILKGARIGKGARIEAGSVVASDIPAGIVARGVPARAVTSDRGLPASTEETLARVTRVVGSTFSVDGLLPTDGPAQVRGWDSLGSLRLLLGVEDEFKIVLREGSFAEIHSVEELAAAVSTALAGRKAGPGSSHREPARASSE